MMRKRISGFVAPLLATCAMSVDAQGSAPAMGWLITPAEAIAFKGEEGFNAPPALRPRAAMPLINILKPEPRRASRSRRRLPLPCNLSAEPMR